VLLQNAREQVRRAACGERHHDRHRPLRPVLRVRRRRDGENGGKSDRENNMHMQPQGHVADAGSSKSDASGIRLAVTPP
jgi:hypothetical protein